MSDERIWDDEIRIELLNLIGDLRGRGMLGMRMEFVEWFAKSRNQHERIRRLLGDFGGEVTITGQCSTPDADSCDCNDDSEGGHRPCVGESLSGCWVLSRGNGRRDDTTKQEDVT